MDFNDLYFFYLIAEHGGFTAAEKASGITKSLLSRRVTQLEKNVNVRLIQRNSRSFSLTSAGKMLFEHAEQMVNDGRLAYESVSELINEPMGLIRVSCPTVLAQYNLAPILPDFMVKYPRVTVTIDATDRKVQAIDEMFDLVLRARPNVDDELGVIVRKITTSQLLLVASPDFINKYGEPLEPSELSSFPTISSVLDRYESEIRWELMDKNKKVIIKHKPVLFCLNPRVQFESVMRGIGIGLIPESIVLSSLKEHKLIRILNGWTTKEQIIHAVFPSRKHMNPAVRAFLDYLTVHLPVTMTG